MRIVGRPRFPRIRRDEHAWRATAFLGTAATAAAALFAGAAIASPVVIALGVLGIFSLFFGVHLRARWKRLFGAPIVRSVDQIGPAHVVTDGRTIRREDVRGAWRVTRGDGRTCIEIELDGGAVVVARIAAEHADEAMRALGIADPELAQKLETRPADWPFRQVALMPFAGGPIALLIGAPMGLFLSGDVIAPIAIGSSLLLCLLVLRLVRPKQLVVASDGVAYTTFGRSRIVPHGALSAIVGGPGTLSFRAAGDAKARSFDLGAEISVEEAIARARASPPPPVVPGMDRGERTVGEWRASIAALVRGGGEYRDAALDLDEERGAVRDARLSVERRVGAALALRAAGITDAIRVAVDEEPSPGVRRALTRVAETDVDDAAIEALLQRERARGRARRS